jgi:hypothetical protein
MPVSRLTPRFTGPGSGKDGFDDIAVNVGESEVAARVPERQLCMIEAKQMQNSRVEVMNMDFVLRNLHPVIIRLAVNHAAADSRPGQPR